MRIPELLFHGRRVAEWPMLALVLCGLAACTAAAPTKLAPDESTVSYLAPSAARQAVPGGRLVGKAKIPEGVLAKNPGVISNMGASVVSSNGGALTSGTSGGAGAVPKGGGMAPYRAIGAFGLLATGQQPLAGFVVQIVDAAGQAVRDPQGQAYEAKTDDAGSYAFAKTPPGRNLLVQLALPGTLGRLVGFLPAAGPGAAREVDLEGVGTHVLGYVLEQVVRREQARLDKLTATAEAAARAEAEAALTAVAKGHLDADSLTPESLVKTVGVWRGLSKTFDASISEIERKVGG